MRYILFISKENQEDNENSILYTIFQYLDYLGFYIEPDMVMDSSSKKFSPMIQTETDDIYLGETECIRFLSWQTNIIHLRDKSMDFVKRYPNYIKRNIKRNLN
jgi:hypothetical protein